MIDSDSVAKGVAGLGGVIVAGRWFLSWWSKQGHSDKLDDKQAKFVTQLENDAARWRELYDETHKLLEAQRETNTLLRVQNAMMRQMLLAKGVTEQELMVIGAVQTEISHGQ